MRFILIGVLSASVFITCLAAAAPTDAGEAAGSLFQNDEALHVTISGPLTTLVRERAKDNYLRGQFSFSDLDGVRKTFDLRMRTRGNFRHRECDYPPILLNFKKSQLRDTLLDGQNKLKLVIHCHKSPRYEQTVLREFLAYRMLNVLTDLSFRVRLLRVSYVNDERDGAGQQRYAFLIEHKKRLAERVGLDNIAVERMSVGALQPDQLNLTSLFAYMIGNTDFSPIAGPPGSDCCHNYVLFDGTDGLIVPVTYDFDQSGFVDAPYARPDERFRIRSVRQRLYRGRCVNNEYLADSLEKFRNAKDDLYRLIRQQEGLEDRVRKALVRYVDDFYDIIDDPREVERRLIDKCI
jgi:hypothetical protein